MSDRTPGSKSKTTGSEDRSANGDGRPMHGGSDIAGAIREQASNLRERISDTVSSVAEEQKKRAAEGVHSAAEATHEAARRLQGSNQSWMAGIVESAADVLNDFSETLRQSEFRSLYERLERFAREQPVVFAVGTFAAGMVLARTTRLGMETGMAQPKTNGGSTASTSGTGEAGYTGAGREC
jgi:hypothetical protein